MTFLAHSNENIASAAFYSQQFMIVFYIGIYYFNRSFQSNLNSDVFLKIIVLWDDKLVISLKWLELISTGGSFGQFHKLVKSTLFNSSKYYCVYSTII